MLHVSTNNNERNSYKSWYCKLLLWQALKLHRQKFSRKFHKQLICYNAQFGDKKDYWSVDENLLVHVKVNPGMAFTTANDWCQLGKMRACVSHIRVTWWRLKSELDWAISLMAKHTGADSLLELNTTHHHWQCTEISEMMRMITSLTGSGREQTLRVRWQSHGSASRSMLSRAQGQADQSAARTEREDSLKTATRNAADQNLQQNTAHCTELSWSTMPLLMSYESRNT